MTPCRYVLTGFWPKRRGIWLTATIMHPDKVGGIELRAFTCRGLAEQGAEKLAALGRTSVGLHENHRQVHPNGPGKPNSRRKERWHEFGPMWHHEGCPHGAVTDGEYLKVERALRPESTTP